MSQHIDSRHGPLSSIKIGPQMSDDTLACFVGFITDDLRQGWSDLGLNLDEVDVLLDQASSRGDRLFRLL